MFLTKSKLLRAIFYPLVIISASSFQAQAQFFPAFTAPSADQSSVQMDAGVSAAEVPNGAYGNALVSVYSNQDFLSYSVSADGLNSVYSYLIDYSIPGGSSVNRAVVNCSGYPGLCSGAIATYNGHIYIAYPDGSTGGLDVLEATEVPGGVGYLFSLVHQDNSVFLTTTPSMVVFNGQLIIIFGATEPYKNAFYSVNFDGTTWNPATDAYLGEGPNAQIASGAKPGLAVLGNTLWMTSQQNNSHNYMFVYSSTDGIHWNPNTAVGPYGQSCCLAIGGGISMVTINNNLVLANQQDSSNHALFVFSSPDGTNWTYQEYSGLYLSNAPALALFNGDVALQYRSNSSSDMETNLVPQ